MEFQITRNIGYSYIPPRCRKPRIGHETRTYNLRLDEVNDDAFPVACIVQKREIGSDTITTTEYRTIRNRLFRPALYSYCKKNGGSGYDPVPMNSLEDAEEAIKKLWLFWTTTTDEKVLEEINRIWRDYLIFDGFLWESAGEPYYSTSFDVRCLYFNIEQPSSEEPVSMNQYMYRADEANLIREAMRSADYASQDVIAYALKCMDEDTITLTDAFVSKYADRETRLAEKLKHDVSQKLEKMVPYIPVPPALLEKMTKEIVSRVKKDASYKKRGYILFDDIFSNALFAELSSLYDIAYTPFIIQ